ncbi:hypothetical protein MG295_00170 [Bacillus phage vB_BcgM]|nr:hypothetical protein MG295_00170 [Bacillus phage vB_BcgM]
MTIPITEVADWKELKYEVYTSLAEKVNALLNGEIIYIKNYEVNTGTSVLARIVEEKGLKISQITYDIYDSTEADRYWVRFNIGLNDLSLLDVYKVADPKVFLKPNKFKVGDIVSYDSVDGIHDTAYVIAVYEKGENEFAYKLSREPSVLYEEKLLISNKFQF